MSRETPAKIRRSSAFLGPANPINSSLLCTKPDCPHLMAPHTILAERYSQLALVLALKVVCAFTRLERKGLGTARSAGKDEEAFPHKQKHAYSG